MSCHIGSRNIFLGSLDVLGSLRESSNAGEDLIRLLRPCREVLREAHPDIEIVRFRSWKIR